MFIENKTTIKNWRSVTANLSYMISMILFPFFFFDREIFESSQFK